MNANFDSAALLAQAPEESFSFRRFAVYGAAANQHALEYMNNTTMTAAGVLQGKSSS